MWELPEELFLRSQRSASIPVQEEDQFQGLTLSLFRHEDMVWARIIGFLCPTLMDESNFRAQVLCSLDAQSPNAKQTPQEYALYLMPAIETHHAFHESKVSVFNASVQSLSRLPICGRHHPKIWPPDVAVDGAREQSPTEPRKVKHRSGDVPWSPAISSGFLIPIQG